MTVFQKTNAQAAAAARRGGVVAATFTASDLTWERCQEQAALAYRAGDGAGSSRLWAQALGIAQQHFSRGDPRLATSLTNQALVMRRRCEDFQAKRLFEAAIVAWADSWRWICLMTPGQPVVLQPSAQRDQLEVYDRAARAKLSALAERGRTATARLERYDQVPAEGLAQWLEIKPKRPSDLRKLLAAVLLIASDRQA